MGIYTDNNERARFYLSKDKRLLAAIEEATPWLQPKTAYPRCLARLTSLLERNPHAMLLIDADVELRARFFRCNSHILSFMLDRGLDWRARVPCGRTALELAVDHRDAPVVHKLLALGADATVPGLLHTIASRVKAGDTIEGKKAREAYYAIDEELIRILVCHGADVNATRPVSTDVGPKPGTPFDAAMWLIRKTYTGDASTRPIVRVLLELGAKHGQEYEAATKTLDKAYQEQHDRGWGQKQCEAGKHEWAIAGTTSYFSGGHMFKSEFSHACRWCGKPKPR